MAIEPIDRDDEEERAEKRRRALERARRKGEVTEITPRDVMLPLPPDDRDDDEAELSLREVWRVLSKHRWVVLGCALFVTVIALVSTLLQTPMYRAAATVQIVQTPSRIVPLEGAEAMSDYWDYDFVGTQLELVKSRDVAQRAVRQLGLVGDPAFEASLQEQSGLARLLTLFNGADPEEQAADPASLDEREGRIVDYVIGHREVRNVVGSKIVEILFVSPDPAIAQRVANGLAHAFREADLARREDSATYARNFLQDQLQQLKLKLEESEKAVIDFAQQQQLASIDQNTELATASLGQLNGVLAQATADRIRAESRWRQAEKVGAEALEKGENKVLDTLREKRADLKAEYESLRSTFKPDYPGLQQLSRRITEVEARIAEETAAYANVVKAEYESALANEQLLRDQLNALQGELLDLQGRSVQFNILKREADTNRQLYDGLLQRFKEIGIAGNLNPGAVSLVDTARLGARFKPDVQRSGLVGLLLGLLAGIALAFVLERLDDTLKTPEDIERHLRLPVIGVVPKVDSQLVAAMADDPRSTFSEAYRSLRTGVQFSTAEGAPRTLLVTSSMQGEGKSTTAMMLARKFAQLGLRVLLVDADMRKPSMHARLNLPTSPGLSEYLSGQVDGTALFKASGLENLTVITAGELPQNPAELLSAPRFRSLLTVAVNTYDQIVIDGPPLLGLADAPILSSVADGTLMVVEAGRARVGVVQGALKRLFGVRANVVGTVMAKYDPRAAGQEYGYGYSDYYYHYAAGPEGQGRKRRSLLKA